MASTRARLRKIPRPIRRRHLLNAANPLRSVAMVVLLLAVFLVALAVFMEQHDVAAAALPISRRGTGAVSP